MASGRGTGFFTFASFGYFFKFVFVGLTGVAVNEGLLIVLQSSGVYFLYAGAVAIEVSILSNFAMNDLWTFKDRRSGHFATRLVKFNVLMLVGLVVNLVILDFGTIYLSLAPALANLVGIGAATLLRFALSVKYAWMRPENIESGQPSAVPSPVALSQ